MTDQTRLRAAWEDRREYPRLYASIIHIWPVDTYRGVLYRMDVPPDGGYTGTYTELARCTHHHRNRRKALECAEKLGRLDGAPSV